MRILVKSRKLQLKWQNDSDAHPQPSKCILTDLHSPRLEHFDASKVFDVERTIARAHSHFVRLPLMGLAAIRKVILLLGPKTVSETPPESIHHCKRELRKEWINTMPKWMQIKCDPSHGCAMSNTSHRIHWLACDRIVIPSLSSPNDSTRSVQQWTFSTRPKTNIVFLFTDWSMIYQWTQSNRCWHSTRLLARQLVPTQIEHFESYFKNDSRGECKAIHSLSANNTEE